MNHAIDPPKVRLLTWCVAGLAIGIACWSIAIYFDWSNNRSEMVGLLTASGIEDATVVSRVLREPVAHHAQLDTARALVFSLLNAPPLDRLAAAERVAAKADRRERLEHAFALARGALRQQPNSWEAAMLQGATTYLLWSLDRDRRLYTESETWQEPLINAWREAPGRLEPRRILGTAYLELWPALSADKKRFATDLLRDTFEQDPSAFSRLGPIWLETMSDTDRALEIIPDSPQAWAITGRYFGAGNRWPRFQEAYIRGLDSRERELTARLADGEQRLTLGDTTTSRNRFARVIGDAPPDQRFVPLVDRALRLYPAGLQTAGTGDSMTRWLRFAIDLASIGKPSLEPSGINRLGGVVQSLTPPESALAALVGGDATLAERLERLDRTHASSAWAPYLIAKARWLLEHGNPAEAQSTLARVGAMGPWNAVYWQAQRDVAIARDHREDQLEAELWLDRIAARSWSGDAWTGPHTGSGRPAYHLVMLSAVDAPGMVVEIASLPPRGGVLRLRLDGTTISVEPVRARSLEVRVETPVMAGLHLLEWSILTDGDAIPGLVRLVPGAP